MSIWEKVDTHNYYREVMGNMYELRTEQEEAIHVRFGTTGNGTSPHYEIEKEDSSKHPFNGLNHNIFVDAPEGEFNSTNLTEQTYLIADIKLLLKDAIERTGRK
jgi:hypothetical protein